MYDSLGKIIRDSESIVFFGGAGVSTESGIPDFRSDEGLYNAQLYFGKSPEDIISRSFFEHKPDVFFSYFRKNLVHRDAQPNEAHYALARLERMGKLKAIITQNIDGLHQKAGSKKVYEVHGTVHRYYCMDCHEYYDMDYALDDKNCVNDVPICRKCGGVVRPDIVLYEEEVSQRLLDISKSEIMKADTLIVGGSSLVIPPACNLIDYFTGDNLIIINKSRTPYDRKADMVIKDSIGKVLAAATERL